MDGPGVYLDIGAHRPQVLSNSFFLDKCLNWRGICVEASPSLAAAFHDTRSCIVVAKAVSLRAGEVRLSESGPEGALSDTGGVVTSAATLGQVLVDAGWLGSTGKGNATSPAQAEELTIDFMSLDVEGHELEALISAPWPQLNVRFLAVENNRATRDVEEFLQDEGYIRAATWAIDDIYVRAPSRSPLRVPFSEPGRLNKLRRTTAIVRRDSFGVESYSHKALYAEGGWEEVLRAARDEGAIPGGG